MCCTRPTAAIGNSTRSRNDPRVGAAQPTRLSGRTRLFAGMMGGDMARSQALLFIGLLWVFAAAPVCAEGAGSALHSVPVTEEPLHVVRHRGDHFIVYTNWIEPGVWTLYHQHRNDLLAVIPADTSAASQEPGSDPRERAAPAGTLVFFPYADSDEPFVHRVGGRGNAPFINIGLEFRDSMAVSCSDTPPGWQDARVEAATANRRGHGYRLHLDSGAQVALPQRGRGLLIVPLGAALLQLGDESWRATIGDFRFYEGGFPGRLGNSGSAAVTLVVFSAC